MAFFDDLGKRISNAGQGVAQSTKNFANITKLNSMITEEEKKVDGLFLQIGKMYYENNALHPEDLTEYQKIFLKQGIQCFF